MEPSRTLSAEALRERLLQGLEAEHVEVEDTTPGRCATSFKVLVVSPCFRGKALLQRHRGTFGNFTELSVKGTLGELAKLSAEFLLKDGTSILRFLGFRGFNELLSEELKLIHAFEQRTLTPEQWEKEQEAK